jgi:hypothetical protein
MTREEELNEPGSETSRDYLQRALEELEHEVDEEEEEIARSNRRKTLLVGLLLFFVFLALAVSYLLPA